MLTHHKRLQIYSFLVLLLLTLIVVFFLLRPFFNVLAASFIVTVLFHPLHERIFKRVKYPALSAVLTMLGALLILLVPLWLLGQLIFNEAMDTYHWFRSSNGLTSAGFIEYLPSQIQGFASTLAADASQLLRQATGNALQAFSQLLSNVAKFVLSFILVLFTSYYWLKDGHHIKQVLMDISPIANSQENILVTRIIKAVNGVVKGTFLVALAQGLIAGIGFWIFGVPNPALWGAFTVLAALVPTVGTSIAMIPAVLYLLITGHMGSALGLTIWGAVAVGLIDNFLGPKIVGGSVKVHPVLILFSILGGVSVFGFLGFLLGPILMAIFVAMVDMYRHDFRDYLET